MEAMCNEARPAIHLTVAGMSDDLSPISRSEARRLLEGHERRSTITLDFEGVERIGQAFADEIFRVFANEHAAVELIAVNALPEVQQMIRRAQLLRDEQGGQLSRTKLPR